MFNVQLCNISFLFFIISVIFDCFMMRFLIKNNINDENFVFDSIFNNSFYWDFLSVKKNNK
jgi:hypothetical protein